MIKLDLLFNDFSIVDDKFIVFENKIYEASKNASIIPKCNSCSFSGECRSGRVKEHLSYNSPNGLVKYYTGMFNSICDAYASILNNSGSISRRNSFKPVDKSSFSIYLSKYIVKNSKNAVIPDYFYMVPHVYRYGEYIGIEGITYAIGIGTCEMCEFYPYRNGSHCNVYTYNFDVSSGRGSVNLICKGKGILRRVDYQLIP